MNMLEINEALNMLMSDTSVPKNVKMKITDMMSELKSNSDVPVVVNKLLNELEEISNDINLQPFVRTQIWNITSMLETI